MLSLSKPGLCLAFMALILTALWFIPAGVSAGPPPNAEYIGSETCGDCHDDVAEGFSETTHGLLLGNVERYEDKLCESCHGPGSAHAEEQDPELIVNPAKAYGMGDKPLCLDCHSDTKFADWQFTTHSSEDVNCASCHSGHAKAGQMLKAPTPDLCYGCHMDVRADFYMPSHHPVAEGKLDCQSCHNIHGSENEFVMGEDSRELCFTCHADKEGPFLFEHEPVNEDCKMCHAPHGTVADNLLVQSEPMVCLNCHTLHFHTTLPTEELDEFTAPNDDSRTLSSMLDGFKIGMLTKCTQCHSEIHGSDLPSQSISSSGKALMR
jgi:DmsE family decaheme c-type cytochrome